MTGVKWIALKKKKAAQEQLSNIQNDCEVKPTQRSKYKQSKKQNDLDYQKYQARCLSGLKLSHVHNKIVI